MPLKVQFGKVLSEKTNYELGAFHYSFEVLEKVEENRMLSDPLKITASCFTPFHFKTVSFFQIPPRQEMGVSCSLSPTLRPVFFLPETRLGLLPSVPLCTRQCAVSSLRGGAGLCHLYGLTVA